MYPFWNPQSLLGRVSPGLIEHEQDASPLARPHSLKKFPNYVFEPRALDYVPEGTFFDFARGVFPKFLENGERFVGYEGDFYWSDIGALEAYRAAQYDVLSGKVKVRIPGEKRGKSLWVGEDAQIHPSATIDGHVLVGRDAVVGRDVTLSGDVTVGSECWIGPNATIKRSILLPGACVGDGAYLEDCIVGRALHQQRRYDVRPGERFRGGALFRSPTERRGSR